LQEHFCEMRTMLSHGLALECREVRGFRGREGTKAASCCPTDFQKVSQVQPLPKGGTNQGKYSSKATGPARRPGLEAQKQIAKQGTPNLPAYGIGTVTEKIGELEGLFDLFEEDFDGPPGTIEVGHAPGTPFHIVGKELHLAFNTINFDEGTHPAHAFGVFP